MTDDKSTRQNQQEHPQHAPDVQTLRTFNGVRRINWTYSSQFKVEFESGRLSDVQDRFVETARQLGFEGSAGLPHVSAIACSSGELKRRLK